MLVDIHGHFGQAPPGSASPARLTTYAGVCGIDLVLVSNRDAASRPAGAGDCPETDANAATLDACEQNRYLAPLYWVRPGRIDSHVNALAGALETAPFVAAVFAPTANGFEPIEAVLRPYLTVLAVVKRVAVFCLGPDERSSPAHIYGLARLFPTVPFVLCACAATAAQRASAADVARHCAARKDADVYVDTAHADAREIRALVGTAGADRVLFGTNALVYGDTHTPRTIALLDELKQLLPLEVYQQVTGGNAVRLFDLGRVLKGRQ